MTSEAVATGTHVLRQMNVAHVLKQLRAAPEGSARVSDLVTATGLSRPAVSRALVALKDLEIIESVGAEHKVIGRPAERFRFRAKAGYVLGVDLGAHTTSMLLTDLSGAEVARSRLATPSSSTLLDRVRHLRTDLEDLLSGAGVALEQLWSVGVATPGIVDSANDNVVIAPSVSGWSGVGMAAELHRQLPCPVLVDNDVNLAVRAEHWNAQSSESLLYVHWGERIGTGLIIDGTPYIGSRSAAGEVGYLDVGTPVDQQPPGLRESPDGLGPFERQCGADAVRTLARTTCRPELARRVADGDLHALVEAAEDGDAEALQVFDIIGTRFARGLAALLLILDPAEVVIGGGLAHAGDILSDAVKRHLDPLLLVPYSLRMSDLRDDAVALGAVRLGLELAEELLHHQHQQ